MQLDKWLKENGKSVRWLCEKLRAGSLTTGYRYIHRDRIPTPENMARIREITNNQVQPNDFYD